MRCTGVLLPLLQQSVMFWNLGLSKLVLRKRLAWQQVVGGAAVVAGVCLAALPADGGTSVFSGVCSPLYPEMYPHRMIQHNQLPLEFALRRCRRAAAQAWS